MVIFIFIPLGVCGASQICKLTFLAKCTIISQFPGLILPFLSFRNSITCILDNLLLSQRSLRLCLVFNKSVFFSALQFDIFYCSVFKLTLSLTPQYPVKPIQPIFHFSYFTFMFNNFHLKIVSLSLLEFLIFSTIIHILLLVFKHIYSCCFEVLCF